MAVKRISYLDKDFDSYKKDLIRFARDHFPNANQDFNEASSGGMLVEMISYVGDVLSFYIDHSFNEQFIDTAIETTNVQRNARRFGYRPPGPTPAVALCQFIIEVPATQPTAADPAAPDLVAAPILLPGFVVQSNSGIDFTLTTTLDFTSTIGAKVIQGRLDNVGNPVSFQLVKTGFVISGATKSINLDIGNFQEFMELTVPVRDITQILDVYDTEGNQYFEVENLFQNVIYKAVNNSARLSSAEPEDLLKQIRVDRRFTKEYQVASRFTKAIFGSGDPSSRDLDSIPNPGKFSTPLFGKETFSNFSIDPRRFTQTSTLGVGPANTTLKFRVRFGGGNGHNVAANTIRKIKIKKVQEPHPNQAITAAGLRRRILDTISVTNPDPAAGGSDPPSVDEIRVIAPAHFAAQSRLVTSEDFIARILSLPGNLGNVFRVSTERSKISRGTTNLRVVSKDTDGRLVTTSASTKRNIQNFLGPNRMLTDNIQILDAQIVNLGVTVSVVKNSNVNKDTLKVSIIRALKTFFAIEHFFIGQHIIEDEIRSVVFDVPGVASVNEITFSNVRGTVDGFVYSNTRLDIPPASQRRGILECPRSGIFEIRFPERDIKVSVK